MPTLKARKTIYLILVIPSIIPWLLMSLLGVTLGIGLLGFIGIYGFRAIFLVPIIEKRRRWTYNILLSLGIIPMAIYLSFMMVNITAEWTVAILPVTGLLLLLVAICLLFEINVKPKQFSS